MALLDVHDLRTEFHTDDGVVEAVNGVELSIDEQETLGLVGESGSGKSVTALSIMGLIDSPGRITNGEVNFRGVDLLDAPEHLRSMRGDSLSMIFQDPMSSLNPTIPIGEQIAEVLLAHDKIKGEELEYLDRSLLGPFIPRRHPKKRHPKAWARSVELMDQTGIPEAESRASEYPHQFSGGMQQRAMIAQAIACEPDLLIADEPTTALDVTIEAQILDILDELQHEHGMGLLLITHDLAVVSDVCDRVAIMYAGQIVEKGPVEEIFTNPKHPYTRGLLKAIPKAETDQELLEIEGQVPNLIDMPQACYFAERCPLAHDACYGEPIDMYDTATGHETRCVLYDEHNPMAPPTERESREFTGVSSRSTSSGEGSSP